MVCFSSAEIKKNVAGQKRFWFCQIYSTTPPSGKEGLTISVAESKDGGAWVNMGVCSERGHGFYYKTLTADQTNADVILYSYGTSANYPGYDWDYPVTYGSDRIYSHITDNSIAIAAVQSTANSIRGSVAAEGVTLVAIQTTTNTIRTSVAANSVPLAKIRFAADNAVISSANSAAGGGGDPASVIWEYASRTLTQNVTVGTMLPNAVIAVHESILNSMEVTPENFNVFSVFADGSIKLKDSSLTSSKFDRASAFPLKSADSGTTQIARVGGDSDTLETLSDQLDNLVTSLSSGLNNLNNPNQYKADVALLATAANLTTHDNRLQSAMGIDFVMSTDSLAATHDLVVTLGTPMQADSNIGSSLRTATMILTNTGNKLDGSKISSLRFDSNNYIKATQQGNVTIAASTIFSANVVQIAGNATSATKLRESAKVIVTGSAIAGTLSTTAMTTDLTEATNDHYKARIIIWTSGVLKDQATDVTAYDGATKKLTYTATTEPPTAGDTFNIH